MADITGNDTPEEIEGTASDDTIRGMGGDDLLFGLAGADTIHGGDGDDGLFGGFDDAFSPDSLFGGIGNDRLFGGDGNDLLDGGEGDDTIELVEETAGTAITIDGGAGNDRLLVYGRDIRSYSILGIETLLTHQVVTGTISQFNGLLHLDSIHPHSAVSLAIAQAGTLDIAAQLGLKDAEVTGSDAGNGIVTGGGDDTVFAGAANDIVLTGAGTDELYGGAGDDTLDGGSGGDSLFGGTGDDLYVVDAGDVAIEAVGEGHDTVRAAVSWVLGAGFEDLALTGTASIDGTGNGAANRLTGTAGDNVLAGGGGPDWLAGGQGNDTYVIDGDDVIVELPGEGTDTVVSLASYALGAEFEHLVLAGWAAIDGWGNAGANVLLGNIAANILVGGAGNDRLDGGGGSDTLIGGPGDDTYVTDGRDTIIEQWGDGTDTVESSVSFRLWSVVENLVLTGWDALSGTGSSGNNTIIGNPADNTLDGAGGSDILLGGPGNDTYVTDGEDWIAEAPGEGQDTVRALVSFTLPPEIENLVLVGAGARNGTGNAGDNRLVGTAADNILNGGGGRDVMIGGRGDDLYLTDGNDWIGESAGEGRDTVRASVSHVLGPWVENLVLTGSARLNGTGNTLDNTVIGNAGANWLSGGAGADRLTGGAGADHFIFAAALRPGNADRITDFSIAADTIRLDNAVFRGLPGGRLRAEAFDANQTGQATERDDRIIFERDTGRLFFDRDGTGGGARVHFATVRIDLALTHADFFVF